MAATATINTTDSANIPEYSSEPVIPLLDAVNVKPNPSTLEGTLTSVDRSSLFEFPEFQNETRTSTMNEDNDSAVSSVEHPSVIDAESNDSGSNVPQSKSEMSLDNPVLGGEAIGDLADSSTFLSLSEELAAEGLQHLDKLKRNGKDAASFELSHSSPGLNKNTSSYAFERSDSNGPEKETLSHSAGNNENVSLQETLTSDDAISAKPTSDEDEVEPRPKTSEMKNPVKSPALSDSPSLPGSDGLAPLNSNVSDESVDVSHLQRMVAELRAENEQLASRTVLAHAEVDSERESCREREESTREECSRSATLLEKEVTDLRAALDEMRKNRRVSELEATAAEAEQRAEELEALYNIQLTSGSEHLATVRADLTATQEKLMDIVKQNDALRGELAAARAAEETALEERRILLDRCAAGETRAVTARETAKGLRRQVDDLQAALQEMARENQTLHLKHTKAAARRWARDSQVTECSNCAVPFSVTVRRHHCRHCGNIFCFECSAKYAMVVSSRKPERVCDTCHSEIMKGS